jgi:hypothetical protein
MEVAEKATCGTPPELSDGGDPPKSSGIIGSNVRPSYWAVALYWAVAPYWASALYWASAPPDSSGAPYWAPAASTAGDPPYWASAPYWAPAASTGKGDPPKSTGKGASPFTAVGGRLPGNFPTVRAPVAARLASLAS